MLLLFASALSVQAQFNFVTNNGAITITAYTGPGGAVVIPAITNGLPVVSIGSNAFSGAAVTNVTIPESIVSIGDYAFEASSLTNVTIPASVTSIGVAPFDNCLGLTAINVSASNPAYVSVGGVLFNSNQTALIEYPVGNLASSYAIPDTVTRIGVNAFNVSLGRHFGNLTNVVIGNSVTNIGDLAFYQCGLLTSVKIPASVTSIGDGAFYSHLISQTAAYFEGNAPSTDAGIGENVFPSWTFVYYLPGTTGWGAWFPAYSSTPTALWNPQVQTGNASFGVRSNQFGFNVIGTTNIPVVIEAATNPAGSGWVPLQSCTLTNGSIYFSDPAWTNFSARFYRFNWP